MKFEELLPVGSVVLLKDGSKKIVIIGTVPIKRMNDGTNITYDYIGVPYPEGYIGPETGLLFNHINIEKIIFTGYNNEERATFVRVIQKIIDQTDATQRSSIQKLS